MPVTWPLGSDLVDWRTPANRASAANPRYLQRVLVPQEQLARTNEQLFWAFWAAKEAAYKALIKSDPSSIFAPRKFVVSAPGALALSAPCGDTDGSVMHEGQRIPVRWTWADDWVHCFTVQAAAAESFMVASIRDCQEDPLYMTMAHEYRLSAPSLATRVLVTSLLAQHGIHAARIQRESRGRRAGPPTVQIGGQVVAAADISLAHDGRFAAAALRMTVPHQPNGGRNGR